MLQGAQSEIRHSSLTFYALRVDRLELYADEKKKSPALIMLMNRKGRRTRRNCCKVPACLVNFEQMLWWSAAEHINIVQAQESSFVVVVLWAWIQALRGSVRLRRGQENVGKLLRQARGDM